MNIPWALRELRQFLQLAELYRPPKTPGLLDLTAHMHNRGPQDTIIASAYVVEQIFDHVLPDWRTSVPDDRNERVNRWCQHIEAAQRTKAALERQEEVAANLGENAPQLNAAHMHHWIWGSARSLWQSRHYREAVRAASVKLNAETQNKLGRRDISETDLFNQAFNESPPQPGSPRLQIIPDEDPKTFKSLHRGVRAFAEGCYAAIRNPISHIEGELTEDQALEQLAAFSVLARWVDDASRETHPGDVGGGQ